MSEKVVLKVLQAEEIDEGEGARVRRLFPGPNMDHLDPFVLLDEFWISPPAGFPDHPHRGFDYITLVLDGAVLHRDSAGNESTISKGEVQRGTTGSGVVHSEMPGTPGMNHGIQLWTALPKRLKGLPPEYQRVPRGSYPRKLIDNYTVSTIVGEGSPVGVHAEVQYLDVITRGGSLPHAVPAGYNALIYVIKGHTDVSGTKLGQYEGAVLRPGATLTVKSATESHYLFIAGRPLNEPIRLRGSFVD